MHNYSHSLEMAVQAAHAAAAVLHHYADRSNELVINHKALNDFVSQADQEAERAILEILRQHTPDIAIVAEESGMSGPVSSEANLTWYIDPLDGTTNFLHGVPHYAVSIGLVAQAGFIDPVGNILSVPTPVLGVIYDPNREEMFTAMLGVGAWLNGHHIQCSGNDNVCESLIATGIPSRDFTFLEPYLAVLKQVATHTRGIRRDGSAALDLAWTACGRFDGYWEIGLSPWDLAAGTALVRAAGGQVINPFDTSEPWPAKGHLVAGTPSTIKFMSPLMRQHLYQVRP